MPGKNLARIGTQSLVERAVEAARNVGAIEEIVVSSDSRALLDEARRVGATALRRPAAIAADTTPTVEVVRHLLREDPTVSTVVVLQPTSPLREADDIQACLDALTSGAGSAATVVRNDHPTEWSMWLRHDGTLDPVFGWEALEQRSQEVEPTYRLNGAVYVVRAEHILAGRALVGRDTRAVVMPAYRSIDIDDEFHLWLANAILQATERGAPPAPDGPR